MTLRRSCSATVMMLHMLHIFRVSSPPLLIFHYRSSSKANPVLKIFVKLSSVFCHVIMNIVRLVLRLAQPRNRYLKSVLGRRRNAHVASPQLARRITKYCSECDKWECFPVRLCTSDWKGRQDLVEFPNPYKVDRINKPSKLMSNENDEKPTDH